MIRRWLCRLFHRQDYWPAHSRVRCRICDLERPAWR